MNISIVIPAYNEIENQFFHESILQFIKIKDIEIIVVCYRKDHKTIQYLDENFKNKIKSVQIAENSRGAKIKFGITQAKHELILVNHPRSIIDINAIKFLQEKKITYNFWGGLTHQFDSNDFFYKFTSFYSNFIRADIFNIFYLDHCIFFLKKEIEALGGFPDVEIFEDSLFSKKMKLRGLATRLPYKSITSSIRFSKNGKLKQSIINFKLKLSYLFLGMLNDKKLNKVYEKDLNLNNSTTD